MDIRTSKPAKGNKYYTRKASGGYSNAIKGKPTDACDVLANCVGYANGRFAEIQGKKKIEYQLVCNAEKFIEKAKEFGLKVVDYPTIGGIMVWQKGATLKGGDGAGHVEIVEKITKFDKKTGYASEVYDSSSAYNSKAFYNVTRSNSNGRWGMGSKYKWRGCIVNPAIGEKGSYKAPETKPDVIYQAYDNKKKDWLGVITNYNNKNSKGYAGTKKSDIGGLRVKLSDGTKITIKSHVRDGKWLKAITKWDNTSNGYSGIKGKPIDAVMIKADKHKIKYRVYANKRWYGWITGYSTTDSKNGYAGVFGKDISAIQIQVIE